MLGSEGFLTVLFNAGIKNELFPVLIFIAVGAMIDFSPLLKDPSMIFFGAAAQFGIFATFLLSLVLIPIVLPQTAGNDSLILRLASAIGIIGGRPHHTVRGESLQSGGLHGSHQRGGV